MRKNCQKLQTPGIFAGKGYGGESHEYEMCGSFGYAPQLACFGLFILQPPIKVPHSSHTWRNSFHGSWAAIISMVDGRVKDGQKLIMATPQYEEKTCKPCKEDSRGQHSRPTIIKILLVGYLTTTSTPGFVLVQLPAFCQRLFGKLIPKKVSQTCDLKQSATYLPAQPMLGNFIVLLSFCSCSCFCPKSNKGQKGLGNPAAASWPKGVGWLTGSKTPAERTMATLLSPSWHY